MRLTKGQVNGIPKTLVEQGQLTPVIQLNQEMDGKIYVWLEKLSTLHPQNGSNDLGTYDAEAAKYADLVLGDAWHRH